MKYANGIYIIGRKHLRAPDKYFNKFSRNCFEIKITNTDRAELCEIKNTGKNNIVLIRPASGEKSESRFNYPIQVDKGETTAIEAGDILRICAGEVGYCITLIPEYHDGKLKFYQRFDDVDF